MYAGRMLRLRICRNPLLFTAFKRPGFCTRATCLWFVFGDAPEVQMLFVHKAPVFVDVNASGGVSAIQRGLHAFAILGAPSLVYSMLCAHPLLRSEGRMPGWDATVVHRPLLHSVCRAHAPGPAVFA